ncbi:alpha-tocopherol transfer protein-like [Atheta coriaria]|uniref:alpha-tocopherol transfer protein-like n=1 Tax=Dalotia coriaria TaxID=877792 RepID=UPI0031F36654
MEDEIKPFLGKDEQGIPFIQNGPYRLRLDLEELDDVYKKRAEEEIGENDEVLKTCLAKLKSLIDGEKGLHIPRDDVFLMKFLRPCKLDADKAFKKMKSLYKLIYKNPNYMYNITPKVVRDVFTTGIIHFLPYRAEGTRIMVFEIEKWDPKVVPLEMISKTIVVGVEIAMKEPKSQLCGVHVILDTKGMNMNHVLACNPWIAKLLMDFIKNVPLRVKGIHVINQPKIFDIAYAIFKPFIRGRLKREIILHGNDWDTLFEHISPKHLPVRYGGEVDIPNIPGEMMVEMMQYYEKDFEEHLGYGYHKKS